MRKKHEKHARKNMRENMQEKTCETKHEKNM